LGRRYPLSPASSCNYSANMRNLWNLPLQRLEIYCAPFELPGGYLKVSNHASCHGPDWIGLEPYFSVIEETIPFRILKPREISSLIWRQLHRRTHFLDENVCVLIDYLNTKPNYFHWFLDALPRILAAEAYSQYSGKPFSILTPQQLQPWQWDSLMLMGLPSEQLLGVPASMQAASWSFAELISSFSHRHIRHSDTGHFDAFSPPAIQALSRRLIEGATVQERPSGSSKRLYVSRGDVCLRRVSNEEAVMDYLSAYGFACISLDNMPLQRQIQLFHQATHIISAHGGALTNLMYLSPGCQVLEIFQTGHGVRPDFFQLTALAGGIYSFSLANSINTKNDIELPIDVLRTFLEASL